MNPVILAACLSPLVIIFIVMKLAVWLSGIYSEEKYVESPRKITGSGVMLIPAASPPAILKQIGRAHV